MPRPVPDTLRELSELCWMKVDGQERERSLRSCCGSQAFVAQTKSTQKGWQAGDKLRGYDGVKMDKSMWLLDDQKRQMEVQIEDIPKFPNLFLATKCLVADTAG